MSGREQQTGRRAPRSDAQRNDAAILQAAARLLARNPTATIQQIADEAGVVRLTVYRRYRNRDALRAAVFEAAATEAQQAVDDALARGLGIQATLRLMVIAMADTAQRYPLIVVGDDLKPLPGQPGRPRPLTATRAFHRSVFELVTRGKSEGVFRSDLPSELFPLAVVGTLNTAIRFAASLRLDTDRLGEHVADLALAGMRNDERHDDRHEVAVPAPPR